MDCKILSIIKKDFDSLWRCEDKGQTVMITTPFSHAFSDLINIYITERSGKFVISDAGDLFKSLKNQGANWDKIAIQKAVQLFAEKFEVSILPQKQAIVPIYYVKVDSIEEISSGVFNMVNFVSAVTNLTSTLIPSEIDEVEEKKHRDIFRQETETFLRASYDEKTHTLDFNPNLKSYTPSVLIDAKYSIQYITGTQPKVFGGETGMASMIYQGLQSLSLIEVFVAYVDDQAAGYQDDQNQQFIGILSETTPTVFRSKPDAIKEFIPV